MKATRIPRDQRILLLAGLTPGQITRWRLLKVRYLTRWAGQLPEGGVLTPTGLAAGCCGHFSFTRWRFPLHRHPGDRPVPEDMQAALRGEAPVPQWFAEGRPEDQEAGHGQ